LPIRSVFGDEKKLSIITLKRAPDGLRRPRLKRLLRTERQFP
jgi:hypothetical protein